jgi:hypothetical protein
MAAICDTPTPELREMLGVLRLQLTWGLSKQARKATEIKARAIEIVLEEREIDHAQIA